VVAAVLVNLDLRVMVVNLDNLVVLAHLEHLVNLVRRVSKVPQVRRVNLVRLVTLEHLVNLVNLENLAVLAETGAQQVNHQPVKVVLVALLVELCRVISIKLSPILETFVTFTDLNYVNLSSLSVT
jgi:hypothetical protein